MRAGMSGVLAIAALAGCAPPIDYDSANDAERAAYLEAASQGVYDGIRSTLLKGRGGVYMKMGERSYDVGRRRIDIRVNVKFREEQPAFNNLMHSSSVLKDICPKQYLDTPMERNDVKIYIRYAMEGGGTMLAIMLSPKDCAPYAGA